MSCDPGRPDDLTPRPCAVPSLVGAASIRSGMSVGLVVLASVRVTGGVMRGPVVVARVAWQRSLMPMSTVLLPMGMTSPPSSDASPKSSTAGGPKAVADILNFVGNEAEGSITESITAVDAELAQQIQELMFVFDNLKDVDVTFPLGTFGGLRKAYRIINKGLLAGLQSMGAAVDLAAGTGPALPPLHLK